MPEPRSLNTVRWQTLNYADLLREEWEDEWFLFHPASGNTHVLNRLAIDILDRINMKSATLAELEQALIDHYGQNDSAGFRASLVQHLRDLDDLGLITPVHPGNDSR